MPRRARLLLPGIPRHVIQRARQQSMGRLSRQGGAPILSAPPARVGRAIRLRDPAICRQGGGGFSVGGVAFKLQLNP